MKVEYKLEINDWKAWVRFGSCGHRMQIDSNVAHYHGVGYYRDKHFYLDEKANIACWGYCFHCEDKGHREAPPIMGPVKSSMIIDDL